MTLTTRYLGQALTVVTVIVCLAACSPRTPSDPTTTTSASVVMPSDPLCGLFQNELIIPLITPGTYIYLEKKTDSRNYDIYYHADSNTLGGDCALRSVDTTHGYLTLQILTNNSGWDDSLTQGCNGPRIDLEEPLFGSLVGSAVCSGKEAGPTWGNGWVVYWGGVYSDRGEREMTTISVAIQSREGRSGVEDVGLIIQMILDYMENSYLDAQQPIPSQLPTQQ